MLIRLITCTLYTLKRTIDFEAFNTKINLVPLQTGFLERLLFFIIEKNCDLLDECLARLQTMKSVKNDFLAWIIHRSPVLLIIVRSLVNDLSRPNEWKPKSANYIREVLSALPSLWFYPIKNTAMHSKIHNYDQQFLMQISRWHANGNNIIFM